MTADAILAFWFDELDEKQWFKKDIALDRQIAERFGDIHRAASMGECHHWRQSPQGRLAEIIVLDQFSRNIHRDTPGAFACDPMALVLAQEAVARGDDRKLNDPARQSFMYMPYMHSESAAIHLLACQLFDQPGLEDNYNYELRHKQIIDRFGRYPHRNTLLGRASTPDELAFLAQPGSSF